MTATERRHLGFRARVLGTCAILLVVAATLGLLVQRTVFLGRLADDVDDSLERAREEMQQLATGTNPATGEPFGDDVASVFETFLARNVPADGEVYLTFVDGAPFLATPGPDGVRLDLDDDFVDRWADVDQGARGATDTTGGAVEYLVVPLQRDGQTLGVFVVASFVDDDRAQVDEAVRVEAVVSALVLVVVMGVAWLLAGRLLRPVRRLTTTARSITESDLTARIPVETDDEIGELAATFNDMLDRLDDAFATQRRFVDDAGHELRTPITIVRGHLEVMGDDPEERAETIALVTDELDRMARIVNDLLLLAKSEQPDFVRVERVESSDLTTELFVKATALGDRRWQLDAAADGMVDVDADRVSQAVLNLVRNAVEHTEPGDEIGVGSAVVDGQILWWVRDSGPGVPEDERAHVFERFRRGRDGGRTSEGAGLGLSIVRAVAEGHGGTVALDEAPGGGARFTIAVPVTDSVESADLGLGGEPAAPDPEAGGSLDVAPDDEHAAASEADGR